MVCICIPIIVYYKYITSYLVGLFDSLVTSAGRSSLQALFNIISTGWRIYDGGGVEHHDVSKPSADHLKKKVR